MASVWSYDSCQGTNTGRQQVVVYDTLNRVALAQAKVGSNVPGLADKVLEFFSSTGPIRSGIGDINRSVAQFGSTLNNTNLPGQFNDDIYKRLKYQYANLYVATGAGLVTSAIGGVTDGLTSGVNQANQAIADALKPVSGFMGATLFSLTNMMKDPIGAISDLPNAIRPVLDQISPTLYSNFVGTYKGFNLGKLFELPGNILGSIQSFVSLVDQILAIPIQLISDLYAFLQDLMAEISDLINAAFDLMQRFLVNIIDNLVPGLTDFLTQLSLFAGQIQGVASLFGGVNAVTNFTTGLISFTNQLNGIIQNPLDFAVSLLPPNITQGIYTIQNPQQIINQLLSQVPELNNFLGQIQAISGFGLNGNMGYGLLSVLQGIQGGVLASIMNGFATQFSILAPLFSGISGGGAPASPNATTPFSTAAGNVYNKGVAGGNIVQTCQNKPTSNYNNPPTIAANTGGTGGTSPDDQGLVDDSGVAQPPPGEENVEPDLPVA